jgi:hypothetical protein
MVVVVRITGKDVGRDEKLNIHQQENVLQPVRTRDT